MTTWPPHLYRRKGREREVRDGIVEAALEDDFLVGRRSRVPSILTLKHLSVLTDARYDSLRKIVERRHAAPYRHFQISKRSGGKRLICVPCEPLMKVQSFLNRRVLRQFPAHPNSMAYVRGRSIVDCASMHCGCQWLIKLDVRRFFESISERQVFRVFQTLGYRPLVAFELARLCTRVPLKKRAGRQHDRRWANSSKAQSRYKHQAYHSDQVGHLPQGAPTSPALSNMCCQGLDESLLELAHEHRVVFSRYADDIVFSTTQPSSRVECRVIAEKVKVELRRLGLNLNSTKTAVIPPGARKVVLGLLVDGDKPRLPRQFRKALECHLYHIKKHGAAHHAGVRGFSSVFGLKLFLEGKLAYATQVEPSYGRELRDRFSKVDWPLS